MNQSTINKIKESFLNLNIEICLKSIDIQGYFEVIEELETSFKLLFDSVLKGEYLLDENIESDIIEIKELIENNKQYIQSYSSAHQQETVKSLINNVINQFQETADIEVTLDKTPSVLKEIVEFVPEKIIKDDAFPKIMSIVSNISNGVEKNQKIKEIRNLVEDYHIQIEDALNMYLNFIREIKLQIDEEKDFIITRTEYNFKSDLHQLFAINLDLSYCDIFLEESRNFVYNLQNFKKQIEKDKNHFLEEQKEKMLKKTYFLLFKWNKRAESNNSNPIILIDGKEDIIPQKMLKDYGGEWENIVKYIDNHYSEKLDKKITEDFFRENIKGKDLKKFTYKDIHFYIKYYKEEKKDIKKINTIKNFLKEWKTQGINDIEKDIRQIVYNYAVNNQFSLFVSNCDDKNELLKEYHSIENDSDKKNYFAQYKFLEKVIILFNQELDKGNELNYDEEYKFFKEIEDIFSNYQKNIDWSLSHYRFFFRVGLQEAFIDGVFIYSSFVLPFQYKKTIDDFEKIKNDYYNLKNRISSLKIISDIKLVKEDIKKQEGKTIEIMGIFLAVIAFVMSSVSGFQFVKDILSAVLFLLVFSTSLISFLFVLLLITSHNENILEKHWRKILIFYVFMLGTICCISYCIEEKNNLLNTNEENKKDTLLEKIEKENLQGKDSLKIQETQIHNK